MPGQVTTRMDDCFGSGKPHQCTTNNPGQLNLPSLVGMSTCLLSCG